MNFEIDVLQKSHHKPVLVDFWAEWCGPCRMLGPVLEQLEQENNNAWELVKIDTEAHADIAQEYRILSIPAVKLFVKGEIVAEFAGAQPKTVIQKWLADHLPDPVQEAFEQLIGNGELDEERLEKLEAFVAQYPQFRQARLALARYWVFAEPQIAVDLLQDITLGTPGFDDAHDMRTIAEFIAHTPDESPAGQKIEAAKQALQNGSLEGVLQGVIEAVAIDKKYADELPRRLGVALFRFVGSTSLLTKQYRWRFDMALNP